MRFSEYVARNKNTCLRDVIPWLQLIYFYIHDWSADDSIQTVIHSKRQYVVRDLLECNINNGAIKGKLDYEYICDDEGNPSVIDPDTEEFATVLNLDRSYVDVKSLITFVVNDIGDVSLIPDELLRIDRVELPDTAKPNVRGK